MAFITTAYFIRNLNIGDISEGQSPVVGDTVNTDFIPYYEKEYLTKALGYPMYTEFMDNLTEQRWIDLRDGVDYIVGGKTYRWNGFQNTDKRSPAANYIYVKYWQENYLSSTTIGQVQQNVQNATQASPANKMHVAWVEMLEMNRSLYHYLNNNRATYPEYEKEHCFGSLNAFNL